MGVSSSESHDLTAFYEMLTASFGVLSQNTGFYPSLDRIVETTLRPLNLGPGGGSYNEPISHLHCLTKQSLFIPTHDSIDSPELTQLFLTHVFSKHGTPSHVTSNRGSEFISHFFRSLGKLLRMELHFTSGYHLEGDGQTEHLNQVLEQYLRAYMNYQQDDWSSLLPLAEFAYNNATNEMTGVSPFFANKGYHPSLVAELNIQVSSTGAQCFISDLDDLHMELKQSITRAQERYQKYADEHCSPAPPLKIGDRVYVKVKYFC